MWSDTSTKPLTLLPKPPKPRFQVAWYSALSCVGETCYFFVLFNKSDYGLMHQRAITEENMKQLQMIHPDVYYCECSPLKAVLEKHWYEPWCRTMSNCMQTDRISTIWHKCSAILYKFSTEQHPPSAVNCIITQLQNK